MEQLSSKLSLPNGAILKNRLAKSAMSENLSDAAHAPTSTLIRAYKRWADGGAGLLITGNVMIDAKAIGEPQNVVVEDKKDFELLQAWAATVKDTGTHLWPQLNHPGRQAIGVINKDTVAPSAVALKITGGNSLFQVPRALTEPEIYDLIERFGNTAAILQAAGFTGVQIHAAHGYLISQFLSPITNQRKDQWGGSLANRAKFVVAVYRKIRERVGKDFPIGIKINSADFQRGGFTEEESLEVIKILSAEAIDLIEISGGTYERAAMMGASKKKSTIEREAYFIDYIEKARKITQTPLMLTGGFRTVSVMENAIADDKLDVVGMARPYAIYPNIAQDILSEKVKEIATPVITTGIKMLDKMRSVDLIWYELQIKRIGEGKMPNFKMSALRALAHISWLSFRKAFRKN
ncbi:MAG: NADH:flavin oxidoreductase/NADH oxidase family protein [Saprospiraceae bacterium]